MNYMMKNLWIMLLKINHIINMKDMLPFEFRCKESGCKAVEVTDEIYSFYCPTTSKYLYKHEVYKFVSLFAKLK